MADPKRAKKITKGKMRLVAKSKWELPIQGSKSYWKKICRGIESKVTGVRDTSISSPTLYPDAHFTIRDSAPSSASCDNTKLCDFSKLSRSHLGTELTHASTAEPIVKIHPPSLLSRDSTTGDTGGLTRAVKSQLNHERASIDRAESLASPWRIAKLSKITKRVNDFLSSTRARVRPGSTRGSAHPLRRIERSDEKPGSMKKKLIKHPSEDRASRESSIATLTSRESRKKITEGTGGTGIEKKSAFFREDIEETAERSDLDEDIADAKPGRPRAPSLSVASAVPSFGRVVISIESVSSIENEIEPGKTKNADRTSNLISRHCSKLTESPSKIDVKKTAQNFLRVPEIGTIANDSYPEYGQSTFQERDTVDYTQSRLVQSKNAFLSKLSTESRVSRGKNGLWPRRSIVRVLRALRAMKQGARSKARIESETNRFFAAPLEIDSPTARSSISSDDRADFDESRLGYNDDHAHRNESEEYLGGESESSYTSVRERLRRNSVSHIGKEFQRTACMDEDNAPEATSIPVNSASFRSSGNSASDEFGVKSRIKKTSATACFVAVPRMAGIFPRMKADKCFGCMCRSLKDNHPAARKRISGIFFNKDDGMDLFEEAQSELYDFKWSNDKSLDRSWKLPVFGENVDKTFLAEDRTVRYVDSKFPDTNEEPTAVEISLGPPSESPGDSAKRSSMRLDVSHKSRAIGEESPKALVTSKSLLSSLSVMSERSKSISDHDDSDHGCIDLGEINIGSGASAKSKYLAPCHAPVNFKPSLEPLGALRQKKSRSIRSRVASAEKSAVSVSDDEDDSHDDEINHGAPVHAVKMKSDCGEATARTDIDGSAGRDSKEKIDAKQNNEAHETRSMNEFEGTRDRMGAVSSKSDVTDEKITGLSTKSFNDDQILSDREVIEIATQCLEENKTVAETLRVLAMEYSNRSSNAFSPNDGSSKLSNVRKGEKISRNLLTLLADSKSYLNRGKMPNEITDRSFSSKQPPLCNSRQLRRVLPLKSYNLVAPILGMAKWYPKRRTSGVLASSRVNTRHKESSDRDFDLFVYPPSRTAHKVSFEHDWDDARPKLSPYALFSMKPRRKAINWRPLTERDLEGYDPEATLKMRAAKITDVICQEFCQWLNNLAAGSNRASGTSVDVLKDMFETDFTAEVCRTMQVSINEMSMVPDAVAAARYCPDARELALTRKHLIKDVIAEKKPRRTVGFGTALPDHIKFLPPRNGVSEKWLDCKNVPTDLETMDAVWKDITHLTSAKGFIEWLKSHPRVSRPKALEKALASKETLVTRQSRDIDGFNELELDIDHIRSLKVGDNDPDAS